MGSNLIDLTKKARIVLEKKKIEYVQAEIVLGIDTSGSMRHLYSDGTVQEVVDRLLAIGMNMDVNKSIEVFTFNQRAAQIGDANSSNHQGFVNDRISNRVGGGTNYAPVMEMIMEEAGFNLNQKAEKTSFFKRLRGKDKQPSSTTQTAPNPTLVFFITDGDNFDPKEAESVIRNASNYPVFWQFVGIGDQRFRFLKELDNMEGRFMDNANFFQVDDIAKISDEELYDRILDEFPVWLKEAKEKGLIV